MGLKTDHFSIVIDNMEDIYTYFQGDSQLHTSENISTYYNYMTMTQTL